ncbi:MAG TPA: ATP-binding protein [Terriglobales bacterium]|nr:ATP-binding protein [Terriglobales bacterium]
MAVSADEAFDLQRYLPSAFPHRLQFELSAKVEAINPAVDNAMCFAGEHGCAGECDFEVRLALQEALANAVVHGCQCDGERSVHCLIACGDSQVLLIVRDPGEGFDVSGVPSPTEGHRLFESHGRGIELIRRLMDEVYFERGGTEIHMVKRCPSTQRENLVLVDE